MNDESSTVRDVARMAGVSTATVSRVVNDFSKVSYETRSRVLAAIAHLQYMPNTHAAELGRSNGGIPKRRGIHTPALVRREGNGQVRSGAALAE